MLHYEFLSAWLQAHCTPRSRFAERGASLVEYALLVALIAVVCIGAVTFLGREVGQSLSNAGSSIN